MAKIRFDSLRFHPLLRRALASAKRSKTNALAAIFAAQRSTPWTERGRNLDLISEAADLAALDTWCRYDPTCPDGWLIRGERRISWAAEARGTGRADTVSEDQWQLWGQRLYRAESDLLWAAELLPQDPTPHSCLITTANGLSRGDEAIVEHFDQALARSPQDARAFFRATVALTEKWSGSHDQMFGIARRAANLARPANDLAPVLIKAHVERWLYFQSFDQDAEGARGHLKSLEVLREVAALFDQIMLHDVYAERADTAHSFNLPAFWFYLTRDRKRLARSLELIRGDYTEAPWHYLGDPGEMIQAAIETARG